jgi:hypothetical protein
MIVLAIIFLLVLATIIIFASPQLSPIPYFPSNPKDMNLIIKSLRLKKNQIVFDLGAGDGIVVFAGAQKAHDQKLNTHFVAVEMNPILAFILQIRRFMHPNKKNIKIIWSDMFKVDYNSLSADYSTKTVYIYVSPRFIPRIINAVEPELKQFDLISYYYPIEKDTKPEYTGIHNVYKKVF